jgi:tetratricopeptide (TPR) repeat protein
MLTTEEVSQLYTKIDELDQQEKWIDMLYEIDRAMENHTDQNDIGFFWHLTRRAGLTALYKLKDFDVALPYLMHSYTDFERIDGGFLEIVDYYYKANRKLLALSLCLVCLTVQKIPDIGCSDLVYDYSRYLLHAKICLDVKRYEDGIESVKKCLAYIKPEDLSEEEFEKLRKPCQVLWEELHEAMEKTSVNE